MIQDAQVYSMIVEHDRVVTVIKQIDQIMNALLDHDLIKGTSMIEADPADCNRAKIDHHDLILAITTPVSAARQEKMHTQGGKTHKSWKLISGSHSCTY